MRGTPTFIQAWLGLKTGWENVNEIQTNVKLCRQKLSSGWQYGTGPGH